LSIWCTSKGAKSWEYLNLFPSWHMRRWAIGALTTSRQAAAFRPHSILVIPSANPLGILSCSLESIILSWRINLWIIAWLSFSADSCHHLGLILTYTGLNRIHGLGLLFVCSNYSWELQIPHSCVGLCIHNPMVVWDKSARVSSEPLLLQPGGEKSRDRQLIDRQEPFHYVAALERGLCIPHSF
jgi:hypothetical protein